MTGVPRPSGALPEEGRRGGNVRDIYYGLEPCRLACH